MPRPAVILLCPSVLPQRPDAFGDRAVVGYDRAAVPEGAEILCRIEAETADLPPRPSRSSVEFGAMLLCAILDHWNLRCLRDGHQCRHVRHTAVKVRRDDRSRAG